MSTTRSGFCQFAVHDRCDGTAAGEPCSCTCHQLPPEPEPTAGHCPTCTCAPPPCP